MTYVVTAKNLSKRYGFKPVLNNLSFNIPAGQIVGLIGPNGAGKSTLLQTLTGINSFNGELEVLGLNPWRDRVKLLRKVSFIPDVNTLPNWLSVKQLLTLIQTIYPNFNYSQAIKNLSHFNLKHQQTINSCSKGMKAQIHLILMLAIPSELLILDEPTLGLDPIAREKFYQSLLTIEKTIIVSSHQISEIEPLLTHVLLIENGNILLYKAISELRKEYKLIKIENSNQEELVKARNLQPIYEFAGMQYSKFLYKINHKDGNFYSFGNHLELNINDLFKALYLSDCKQPCEN